MRAYDSIQLASAITARNSFAEADLPSPVFLTADDRLLMAARAEGFDTDNPNLYRVLSASVLNFAGKNVVKIAIH